MKSFPSNKAEEMNNTTYFCFQKACKNSRIPFTHRANKIQTERKTGIQIQYGFLFYFYTICYKYKVEQFGKSEAYEEEEEKAN